MAEKVTIRFKLAQYLEGYKVAASIPEIAAARRKQAVSLPDLVQQTNDFSIKNRPGCSPALVDSNKDELFLDYKVTCDLKESDPNGHDVRVKFDVDAVEPGTVSKNLDVEASCSCPAFLWWGAQWNMHQRDALYGEPRPLLTAPTERLDLRGKFIICKHLKAVFERILPSVQHNIVKILRKRDIEQRERENESKGRPSLVKRPQPKKPPAVAPSPGVVERSTPATPKEKQRVPSVKPVAVPPKPSPTKPSPTKPAPTKPAPTPAPEPPKRRFAPVPTIEEYEEEPPAASEPLTTGDREATEQRERSERNRQRKPLPKKPTQKNKPGAKP